MENLDTSCSENQHMQKPSLVSYLLCWPNWQLCEWVRIWDKSLGFVLMFQRSVKV